MMKKNFSFMIFLCFLLTCCSGLKENQQKGVGLKRDSFGKLNHQPIEPGISYCNPNIGMGADAKLKDFLGSILNPPRNVTGNPDQTLVTDEIDKFFPFVAVAGEKVVIVIERNDHSIDFWLTGDAVRDAHNAEKAANYFCKSRDNKIEKYIGFSYKCGKDIPMPLSMNGQRVTVKEEEIIIAYDCIAQESPTINSEEKKTINRKKNKKK